MLSKLEFFEADRARPEPAADRETTRIAIERHFSARGCAAHAIPAVNGSLGLCFHAEIAGRRRFLKTHLPGAESRLNLVKEAEILLRLYGDAVVVDRFDVEAAGDRLCLVMAELAPLPAPMQPNEAAALVGSYTKQLGTYRPAAIPSLWDFEHYLACGRRAVVALSERSLIGSQTASELNRLLGGLYDGSDALPHALCHGDLGPKNIMTDGVQPIAIDWEDAFWGIAGYDYLYWLTFMDNRPFLHSAAFGQTGLKPNVERAILALVVLLKSFLSVRSDAYLRHAMPIEARIAEVLDLPRSG